MTMNCSLTLFATIVLLACVAHVAAKLAGEAESQARNENGRALDTTDYTGTMIECPAASCHFCVNPHKHTWAEHEYEALERGCNLATIKNERNQMEIEGLIRDQGERKLFLGGIYAASIKSWTFADGWPSMRFSNWIDGAEPSEEIGSQVFMALMVTEEVDSLGKWIHVDGDEELGAVYKCCKSDYNSGIAK